MRIWILSSALSVVALATSKTDGPARIVDLSELDFSESSSASFNAEYPYLPGHLSPSEYISYNVPLGDGASMFLFPVSDVEIGVVVALTRWEVPLALEVRIRDDIDWAERRSDVMTKLLTGRLTTTGVFAAKSKAWGPAALKAIEPAGLVNPVEFEKVSESLPWVVSESCNGWPLTVVPTRVFAKFQKATSRMQPQHMTLLCENAKKLEVYASQITGWPAINWAKMQLNLAFPPIVSVFPNDVKQAETMTGIKQGSQTRFERKLTDVNQEYVAAEMIVVAAEILGTVSSPKLEPSTEKLESSTKQVEPMVVTTDEGLVVEVDPVYTSSLPGSIVRSFKSEAELVAALKREVGLGESDSPAVSISVEAEGFSNFRERFLLRATNLYMPSDLLYRVGYDVDGLTRAPSLQTEQLSVPPVSELRPVSKVFVGEVLYGRYILVSVPAGSVRALISLPDITEVGSDEGLRSVATLVRDDYSEFSASVNRVRNVCALEDPKSIISATDAYRQFGSPFHCVTAVSAFMQLMQVRSVKGESTAAAVDAMLPNAFGMSSRERLRLMIPTAGMSVNKGHHAMLVRLINFTRLERAPALYTQLLSEASDVVLRLSRPIATTAEGRGEIVSNGDMEKRSNGDTEKLSNGDTENIAPVGTEKLLSRLAGLLMVGAMYDGLVNRIGIATDSLVSTGRPFQIFAHEAMVGHTVDALVSDGSDPNVIRDVGTNDKMIARIVFGFLQAELTSYAPLIEFFRTGSTGVRVPLLTSLYSLVMMSDEVPAPVKVEIAAAARSANHVSFSMTPDVDGRCKTDGGLDSTLALIRRVVVAGNMNLLRAVNTAFLTRTIPFSVSLASFSSTSGQFITELLSNPAYAHTATTMFGGMDLYYPNIIVEGAVATVAESKESVNVLADFIGRALREYNGPYIKVIDGRVHIAENSESAEILPTARTQPSAETLPAFDTLPAPVGTESASAETIPPSSADAERASMLIEAVLRLSGLETKRLVVDPTRTSASPVKTLTSYEQALRGVRALGGLFGLFGVHRAVVGLGFSTEIEHVLSQPYMSIKDKSFPISSPMLREFVLGIMEVYTAGALNNAFDPAECAKRLQSDLVGVEVTSLAQIINTSSVTDGGLRYDEVVASRLTEAVMGSATTPGFGLSRFAQMLLGSSRIPPPTPAIASLIDQFGYMASNRSLVAKTHARFDSEQTATTKHVVFLRYQRLVYISDAATPADIKADLDWYWNQRSSA